LVLELVTKVEARKDASLRSWLVAGQPLPWEQSILFALQITSAMKHATSVIPGFVHRDLKPENLLVGADNFINTNSNCLRVTDFGLAHILEIMQTFFPDRPTGLETHGSISRENFSRTQLTHSVVGTPFYMAPELWRGEPVTMATDIYALGCIMYEMIAGEKAVIGDSLELLQDAHCGGKIRPLPNDIPGKAKSFINSCLAVDVNRRFGSWDEVDALLGDIYSDITGKATPTLDLSSSEIGKAERIAYGWAYSNIGYSYLDLGKSKEAIGYFAQAQAIGEKEKAVELEIASTMHLGIASKNLDDVQRAIGYYEKALGLARRGKHRAWEQMTLGNMGVAYRHLGDFQQAMDCSERQRKIAHEMGDFASEEMALGNLGNVNLFLGNLQKASEFYKEALSIAILINDRRGQGRALGNLGNVHSQLGNAQEAIRFFEQALIINQEIGSLRDAAGILLNLGIAYGGQGNTELALSFAQRSAQLYLEIHDPNLIEAQRLIDQLQNRNSSAEQEAFIAFQRVDSYQEMVVVASKYPFIKDDEYIQVVAQTIEQRVPTDMKPAFERRLAWLKQIASKENPGILRRLFGKK
jgi:tetratricopeptide (TPR) repeat protein